MMAGRHLGALTACTRLAEQQHGVISRQQALEAGLSPDALQRLLSAGLWVCARRGVYELWQMHEGSARWTQRLMAVALWLGKRAVVCRRAAGRLLEVDGLDGAPLEFLTTGRHRTDQMGLFIHHVRTLDPNDVTMFRGFQVTTATRMLLDIGPFVPEHVLEVALESVLRKRLATREQLVDALAKSVRAGKRTLEELLAHHPGTANDSTLETYAWRLLVDAGLPAPVRQYEVRDEAGVFIAKIDLAYPDLLIAIEADGYDSHSSVRDWQRDRTRQNELVKRGWIVYRVTWRDVRRRKAGVVSDVRALRAARAGDASIV